MRKLLMSLHLPVFYPSGRVRSTSLEGVVVSCPGGSRSYLITSFVSEGTYGMVYLGIDRVDGTDVAIKVSKERWRVKGGSFVREYRMHRLLAERMGRRKPTVDVIDAFVLSARDGQFGALVMERMDGTLGQLFRQSGSVNVAMWVACCNFISSAVLAMHSVSIYHMDIKPGNVMYKKDGTMKLVDLGLGCCPGRIRGMATGTYVPPEWRDRGRIDVPTFDPIDDASELEIGENYSVFMTCRSLFKGVAGMYSGGDRVVDAALALVSAGVSDDAEVRCGAVVADLERITRI